MGDLSRSVLPAPRPTTNVALLAPSTHVGTRSTSIDLLNEQSTGSSIETRQLLSAWHEPTHAIARSPPLATNVRSFKDAPRGRFSPRSHWLTVLGVTLRYLAKTA